MVLILCVSVCLQVMSLCIYKYSEACEHNETTNHWFIVEESYHNVSKELLTCFQYYINLKFYCN